MLEKREGVQSRVIVRTASRGEFLASLDCLYDKRAELTTSAFCFRVQTHYKINLVESAAFEITTEKGETNTKNKSRFLASSIATTQLTDILSPYQGLESVPTLRTFPRAF